MQAYIPPLTAPKIHLTSKWAPGLANKQAHTPTFGRRTAHARQFYFRTTLCKRTISAICMATSKVAPAIRAAIPEYAAKGPLLAQCGFAPAEILEAPDRWIELGQFLSSSIGYDGWEHLNEFEKKRVYHFYLPVFFYVEHQLAEHAQRRRDSGLPDKPLVFGISAPQGSGKSTLVEQLVILLQHTGRSAVDVSIDDFYLTYQDQRQLAEGNPENPLLQVRGNAGTHDLALGAAALQALISATSNDAEVRPAPMYEVAIPRYDKSQQGGKGDRAPQEAWPVVHGRVDVVLFEGWMLGFTPHEADAKAAEVEPHLAAVNARLREYVTTWDSFVDSWLVIKVASPEFVYKWRREAETRMREKGKPGMTDEQVVDFVDRYMPAYKAYLGELYAHGPSTAKPGHVITVELDDNREPLAEQVAPDV